MWFKFKISWFFQHSVNFLGLSSAVGFLGFWFCCSNHHISWPCFWAHCWVFEFPRIASQIGFRTPWVFSLDFQSVFSCYILLRVDFEVFCSFAADLLSIYFWCRLFLWGVWVQIKIYLFMLGTCMWLIGALFRSWLCFSWSVWGSVRIFISPLPIQLHLSLPTAAGFQGSYYCCGILVNHFLEPGSQFFGEHLHTSSPYLGSWLLAFGAILARPALDFLYCLFFQKIPQL